MEHRPRKNLASIKNKHNILYYTKQFNTICRHDRQCHSHKWKFIVEFEDQETGTIAGTLGEAADRDECEVLIEEEMEYRRLRGYIRVSAEAVELCEQCEGEGSIPVEDAIVSICDACGGRIGILSSFKRGRGAEMKSTQLHLRQPPKVGPDPAVFTSLIRRGNFSLLASP